MQSILSTSYEAVYFFFFNSRRGVKKSYLEMIRPYNPKTFFNVKVESSLRIYSNSDYRVKGRVFHFFSSSIEVLRMQRENQQLRKTIDELKHSGDRIIELEAENEQLQKASLEGKHTVFTLNEVRPIVITPRSNV